MERESHTLSVASGGGFSGGVPAIADPRGASVVSAHPASKFVIWESEDAPRFHVSYPDCIGHIAAYHRREDAEAHLDRVPALCGVGVHFHLCANPRGKCSGRHVCKCHQEFSEADVRAPWALTDEDLCWLREYL